MKVKVVEKINVQNMVTIDDAVTYNTAYTNSNTAIECIKNIKSNKANKVIEIVIKRFIDIIGGICGLIILLPITLLVIIAKKVCKDKEPLFFCQKRVGKNGKIFKMYKYRTMIQDADKVLEEYLKQNENARKEYEIYKKIKNDPRITKVGKFLRKTSIDEMPQFINVIKGEMSLVGPRPYIPTEIRDMGIYYDYIIKMKPGITGPWQCGGRSLLTFKDRLDMDFHYYNNAHILLDIKILLKTVLKVFKKEGAN